MRFFAGMFILTTLFAMSCTQKKSGESVIAEQTEIPVNVSEVVVTGKSVDTLFPSTNDIQLFNAKITFIDESVRTQRKVVKYFITLSAQRDRYLPWFYGRNKTLETPLVVTIIKRDTQLFPTTVLTGYRKALSTPFVDLITLGDWMVEGVQYNPPMSQNPKNEFFIVEPLSKTINISLDFGTSGRFELNSEKLKAEYDKDEKRFFAVDIGSSLIPRIPEDTAR